MDQPNNDNEENFWKWGFIYYNPVDTKILVGKRYGIGWTFNFARPLTYVLLLGIVLVIAAIKYYIK